MSATENASSTEQDIINKSNDTDDLPAYSQHEAVDTACAQLSKLFDQHAQLIHSLTARIN